MPSTYTLNNGIELIGTGEQSGTWGDTTNTNLELLDTSLDGQVSVTLAATGSSGSPNTLPISNGASSNGRNRLVIFGDGGDLGGTAFVQLTPNDAEKIVYVRNSLSGSRSILLFQGTYNASNDYEVPAGTTAVVFFNGAGTGAVAANVFNNAYFDGLRLGSVSVTAILDEDNMASNDAAALATQQSIKAYVDTQVGANNELSEVLANGNTTGGTDIAVSTGDDITFVDSSKAIFGAGSDLQIYHDGSAFYIQDTGTGALYLQGDGGVNIRNAAGTENKAVFSSDGAVTLYYDNAAKFATTSTGVDITGTLTSDGLTVDGSATEVKFTTTAGRMDLFLTDTDTTDGQVRVRGDANSLSLITDTKLRQTISSNGDISFYEDTGTTAKFFWDASAESLGIGTSSPSALGHINSGSVGVQDVLILSQLGNTGARDEVGLELNFNSGGVDGAAIRAVKTATNGSDLTISTGGASNAAATERMRIDSSGNLLVGKTVTSISTAGHTFGNSGWAYHTGSGFAPLSLNRQTSDGSIVDFFKDGSTVGSIGIQSSGFYIDGESGHAGLRFGQDVIPRHNGADDDDQVSLGESGIRFKDLYLSNSVKVITATNGTSIIDLGDTADSDIGRIAYNNSVNAMYFKTNNSEAMRIDSSGNVGIGTISPAAPLHVAGTIADNPAAVGVLAGAINNFGNVKLVGSAGGYIDFTDTSAGQKGRILYTVSDNAMSFRTNGANERMRIDSSGNVGIGTSSPSGKLHVTGGRAYLESGSGDQYILKLTNPGNSDGVWLGSPATDTLAVYSAAGSERMRIDSSGTLLVGKTSTGIGTVGHQLQTNGIAQHVADNSEALQLNRLTSDGAIAQFRKDGSTVGSISVTGSATAYNTSSDHRLKENVVELTGATDRVKQLEPKRFNFIADADTTVDGFLAHEVQSVVPEAITGTHNEVDADDNPVYQGIDQSKLVPLLVATIKELEARITALENA